MEKISQRPVFKKTLKVLKHPITMIILTVILVYLSNFYLQLSQNNLNLSLAYKFATQWHVEKFILGCLVLLVVDSLLIALSGSFLVGNLVYAISILLLGVANYLKMSYRQEPIYPDDLKMITEWSMLGDIIGKGTFSILLAVALLGIGIFLYQIYRSFKLSKKIQYIRLATFGVCLSMLWYVSLFNQPTNLLRKAYDKTALWIPYSQKMNYYNTGFMGGFLYNLKVEAMEEPDNYSQATIDAIVDKYTKQAQVSNDTTKQLEKPNIVFVMSESFSDPNKLNGIDLNLDPLEKYQLISEKSLYTGEMLSQNYGGGTANIEFEALSGFSMALLNSQMTTPYTMMLPKEKDFPSIVSTLKNQDYKTTAIHPYNTSMYKRKDVYSVLGFDNFLDENTMEHTEKITENSFISDQSAFDEVTTVLSSSSDPQFVHLVTMQTHMPYNTKYPTSDFKLLTGVENKSIENYAQDIYYTTDSLTNFIDGLEQIKRQTIVVFWGDHLPSIYSDEVITNNDDVTTHLTEYFIYDSKHNYTPTHQTVSPFYFSSLVSQMNGVYQTGFNALLLELYSFLPAFEKQMYLYNEEWHKEIKLTEEEQVIFDEYKLIEYDIVSGEKYSKTFFDVVK